MSDSKLFKEKRKKTSTMKIRKFQEKDAEQIIQLHHETLQAINSQHYTPEQLAAFSMKNTNPERLNLSYAKALATIVATEKSQVICFGNIGKNGHLRQLYTHKEHQRKGAAKQVLRELERQAILARLGEVTLASSLTAHTWYQQQGYQDIERNTLHFKGIPMEVITMRKTLDPEKIF